MEAPAGKNSLMYFLERTFPQCRVNVLYKAFDANFKSLSMLQFYEMRKYPLIVQNVNLSFSGPAC